MGNFFVLSLFAVVIICHQEEEVREQRNEQNDQNEEKSSVDCRVYFHQNEMMAAK